MFENAALSLGIVAKPKVNNESSSSKIGFGENNSIVTLVFLSLCKLVTVAELSTSVYVTLFTVTNPAPKLLSSPNQPVFPCVFVKADVSKPFVFPAVLYANT